MNKTFAALLCVCFSAACLGPAPRNAGGGASASAPLDPLFAAFRNPDRGVFRGLVSEDFIPSRNDYVNAADAYFREHVSLEFSYSVDRRVQGSDGAVSVTFTWQRKALAFGSAVPVLSRGAAEFVLREERGGWLLRQVKGGDPFRAP